MDVMTRIERALQAALARTAHPGCPPRLGQAMHHAVFPRGARIRPRLTLAVAAACGEDAPSVSDAAAIGIELMHCASLIHDDLPCFDDADTRRGRSSYTGISSFAEPSSTAKPLHMRATEPRFGGVTASTGLLVAERHAGEGTPVIAPKNISAEPQFALAA